MEQHQDRPPQQRDRGRERACQELRTTFASQEDALAAARAEWLRIKRGIFEFEITLAYGRADITPQRPARVAGYKPQIDETPWIVTRLRHSLDSSGLSASLPSRLSKQRALKGRRTRTPTAERQRLRNNSSGLTKARTLPA